MIHCTHCGNELEDDAVFCPNCGTAVEQDPFSPAPAAQGNVPPVAAPPREPSEAAKKAKEFFKKHMIPISIAAAVLIVIIAVVSFVANLPQKVKLNDYIKVEFTGYDTVGSATVTFNKSDFMKDYGDKIEFNNPSSKNDDSDDYNTAEILTNVYLSGRLDKNHELSNGDEITYKWDVNKEEAEFTFDVELIYDDITFTVENLQAATEVDPFADLEVSFYDTAPYGQVEWQNVSSEEYGQSLYFNAEPDSGLKNGDTVTLRLSNGNDPDWNRNILESYGVKFSATEKTFTVSGLSSYVTKIDEINEAALADMTNQGKDIITADIANHWDDPWKLDDSTFIGTYLLTAKSTDASTHNTLYLVYENNASAEFEVEGDKKDDKEEGKETKPKTEVMNAHYYYVVYFNNLIVNADGSITVDLTDYDIPGGRFDLKRGWDRYTFKGYPTMDEMVKDCVQRYVDNYTYETTISE